MCLEDRIRELELENEILRADVKRLRIEKDHGMILDIPKEELAPTCIRLFRFLKNQEDKSVAHRIQIIEFMKENGFEIPEEFLVNDKLVFDSAPEKVTKTKNLIHKHLADVHDCLLKVRQQVKSSKE
ncbi:unnamed protein product [Bursaphelenchus xylophilus]|uniref:(pine wood nematode) hypothetical protein n=1 Tax=Bursaphelenchus xylophilus TaxID=6326 RepID=A0A1I7S8T0_BURXY|nr:unnamed protein product [Bursaphelenchus xylophilus]CAG9085815.1 unnamed protein product [Bursaphelenchus xylophilus]